MSVSASGERKSERQATMHLVGAASMLASRVSAIGSAHAGRLTPRIAYERAIRLGLSTNAPLVLVGPGGAEDDARASGIEPRHRIAAPIGSARMARSALRRIAGGIDRIVCWYDELAVMAAGIAEHTELVSTQPYLCSVPHRRLSGVTCLNQHDAARWAERGIIPNVIDLTEAPIQPHRSRPATRERFCISSDALLFVAVADNPLHADARGLIFMLTVLHATGFPVQAVIPRGASNMVAARRHHRATGQPYPLLLTERPASEWLAAADVAVLPVSDRSGGDALLESECRSNGCEIIRMDTRGKPTIGPGSDARSGGGQPLLDRLDKIVASRLRVTADD
ncbi:MAG: hypothetical protein AAGA55_11865 [Planctomycetota bacterium]